MMDFTLHDVDSAPEAAKPLLAGAEKQLGFIPNLYAGLAESPASLAAYLDLSKHLGNTNLSPTEQQVIALVASAENNCEFCMGAHSFIARNMVKVDDAIVDALRQQEPLADSKLQALADFTLAMIRQRGWVSEANLEAFVEAGYTRANVLDVVLGVTMKTLSNYANHVLHTPLNEQFASETWSR